MCSRRHARAFVRARGMAEQTGATRGQRVCIALEKHNSGGPKGKDSERERILDVHARNTRTQRLVHVAGRNVAKGVEAEAAHVHNS